MKRRSVLKKQAVKRKRTKNPFSGLWMTLRVIGSLSLKCALLLIGVVGISLLFLFLYQYLLTSPHIRLERVLVKGVDKELKEELMDISQLSSDMSLLAINLKELKERMERHPWVKSIEMEKRFPHTLIIHVEREVPRALVALEKLFYMNNQGRVFKEVEQIDDMNYPVITGVSKDPVHRLEQLTLAAHILDLLESESGPWSLKELSEIHLNTKGSVSLYSTSMQAVVKLRGKELDIKKGELKKVVTHLRSTGLIHMVKRIDLNYRNGVVVSFKEDKSGPGKTRS